MKWQPIETAPEDTYVLVWSPEYYCYEYGIAVLGGEEGYWLTYEGDLPLATPTHWMHLPEPPEEDE